MQTLMSGAYEKTDLICGKVKRGHRVLVIDDSELIREAAGATLSRAGFDVRLATDPNEFEELLASWWPDTVLADINMPEVNGVDLCRQIRSRVVVRVVFFSSMPRERLAGLAASMNAEGYISKLEPFELLAENLATIIADTSPPAGQ